jgi:hypothetical protein
MFRVPAAAMAAMAVAYPAAAQDVASLRREIEEMRAQQKQMMRPTSSASARSKSA